MNGRTAHGLVRAAHPVPAVAVIAFVTVVAAATGRSPASCLLAAVTVLAGQLSIGWCNDAADAARDRRVDRQDKPIVAGLVDRRVVLVAAGIAVVACVPLSLANGLLAGAAHLVNVAAAWAYNLGLKRTPLSWVAYAVGFGVLPGFVTLGLPGHPWPAPWGTAAAALLGLGAHLANVLPDIADDLRTDVRGLPQRLGARLTRAAIPVPLVAASVVLALGPPGPPRLGALVALALAVVVAGFVPFLPAASTWRRVPFLISLVVAAIDVALFALSGSSLAG
ncbi:MAG: UbiA family prenyltransferase [Streptosporangiales bacterium]